MLVLRTLLGPSEARHDLVHTPTVRAQHCAVTVLRNIQHTQGACVGADAQLAAVQGDVDLGHTALVLGLQEKIGEVQGPQTKLVILRPGHGVTVDVDVESRKVLRKCVDNDKCGACVGNI